MIYANPNFNLTTTDELAALQAAKLPTDLREWTPEVMAQAERVLADAQTEKIKRVIARLEKL